MPMIGSVRSDVAQRLRHMERYVDDNWDDLKHRMGIIKENKPINQSLKVTFTTQEDQKKKDNLNAARRMVEIEGYDKKRAEKADRERKLQEARAQEKQRNVALQNISKKMVELREKLEMYEKRAARYREKLTELEERQIEEDKRLAEILQMIEQLNK